MNAPVFELTSELKGLQEKMTNLFMRQKSRGGIIDLNAEDSNVISIDSEDDVKKRTNRLSPPTNFINGTSVSTLGNQKSWIVNIRSSSGRVDQFQSSV